jgi:hypothetical protein
MTIDEALRLIAGIVVLISLALAIYINLQFLWLSAFVAINLMQSAFTRWCPMMTILQKAGFKDTHCP